MATLVLHSQFPKLAFGLDAVRAAGRRLSRPITDFNAMSAGEKQEVYDVFAVANSWRNSHVFAMRSVHQSISYRMRTLGCSGFTAARPKRMASIRRKLASTTLKLDQIQDIAGCRAVLDNIDGAHRLVASIRDQFPHHIRREFPYIEVPKQDGYRSHHFALDFSPNGKADGRRVELQIRTRLQHSWATAVEAVGLFLGQDLKHHRADADWLRIFELMSAEFARAENCPVPPNTPERNDCIKELRELNKKIGAASLLEDIKTLTHYAENYIFAKGRYYVIRYRSDHTVEVDSFDDATVASNMLGGLEGRIEYGDDDSKVVLVEVDKVDKLVEAYPNYFGDVSLFVRNLNQLCLGNNAIEYSMAPQQLVAPRPQEKPDLSAIRRRYTKW